MLDDRGSFFFVFALLDIARRCAGGGPAVCCTVLCKPRAGIATRASMWVGQPHESLHKSFLRPRAMRGMRSASVPLARVATGPAAPRGDLNSKLARRQRATPLARTLTPQLAPANLVALAGKRGCFAACVRQRLLQACQ